MNKFSKLFAGFAAVALMASCSNDEPKGTTPDAPEGDVAYMTIEIKAPEMGARATTSPGYEESDLTPSEHAVKSVDFYFFQQDGTFAFSVKADDTNFVPKDGNATNAGNGNVEYIGSKNIVILEGVHANNYPEYVLTVLNKPADFEVGATLAQTAKDLTAYAATLGATTPGEAPFVMTTSSFFGEKNGENGGVRHDNTNYYVTKLNVNDFMTSLSDAQNNPQPVEIYVERLAAKVQVVVKEGLINATDSEGRDVQLFKLQQTVAGGDDNTSGGDGISDIDLYVGVLGWGLNTTVKESYMSKQLDATWKDTAPFSGWDNVNDWRSFWAKTPFYGQTYNQDNFNYKSPKEVWSSKTLGAADYCYENTNTPNKIFAEVDGGSLLLDGTKVAVENAKVTSVVLAARVYQLIGGQYVAPELVQFRGVLYTGASYKSMLLNKLKGAEDLNYWLYTGTSDPGTDEAVDHWRTIGTDELVLKRNEGAGHKVGQVDVVLWTPTETGEQPLVIYSKNAAGKFEVNTNAETQINAALAATYDFSTYPATGTNDGEAYYIVPIEHLAATAGQTNAVVGYYGVVRNHWYKLTVNSISKVGHLVFEPETDDTPIIPEGPQDPDYYVGASINILSWKVVNQNVDI